MTERPIVLPHAGLGNNAYVLDLGDGRALAIDAGRDLRALRRTTESRGLRVAFAADTHLHADFLSGAVQLATEGAEVLASRAGHRSFPHRGLADGDEVDLGGLSLRALGTPGHTDEHLSFLLLDGMTELGVFSGGSLLIGSAARTDLVAPDRTEDLARAQYRSLRRLAELSPETALWPTHGGGSFCASAAASVGAVSTIGDEVATNPLLRAEDEDAFVRLLLDGLGTHPPYFHRLAEINRRGPRLLGDVDLPAIDAAALAGDVVVVDVRQVAAFAARHLPGSISIPLRPAFASWLGWLVPDDRPVAVVRDADQDPEEIAWAALEIGYENIVGVLVAPPTWPRATASVPLVEPGESADLPMLDIRQEAEYATGHLPGARHIELGSLADEVPDVAGPVLVMCGHGERAMSAASLLARRGIPARVLDGGPEELAAARGTVLVAGA